MALQEGDALVSQEVLHTDPKLAAYRRGDTPVPATYWLWPLYGAGLENLGVDDRPTQARRPILKAEELLVRHDAVGLCFSDTKIIKAGESHPRLGGRDMRTHPVVMGHEVALTVIDVGENLRDQYHRGDRFIVQADIYYKGRGLAYGYALQGGFSQYNVIGEEVLAGDDGCYLVPVQPETGYAQAALTEPWACVVRSYDVSYRSAWKPQGLVLIVGTGEPEDRPLGELYPEGEPPALIVSTKVRGPLLRELRERTEADGIVFSEILTTPKDFWQRTLDITDGLGYDDIVVLDPKPETYELVEPLIRKEGLINLVGLDNMGTPPQVDVGRIHYDSMTIIGTNEREIAAAYHPVRTNLRPGGKALFIGAAGPMGQMHFQRALQLDDGPALVVATDLDPERLGVLETKYEQLIAQKRAEGAVILRTPGDMAPDAFNESLLALTDGEGFDDIVVLAPSARVVAGAIPLLAPGATMNIFAGLPKGTMAPIDLKALIERGIHFTGTSGSGIDDLRNMLDAAEAGRLNPNLSVAAIAGLRDVKTGLEGVMHQTFPGKVVIYPQILDFPLTTMTELKDVLPKVYAKLGPNESWTVEAEAEFLKEQLP
jgi:threonine dehydrogenase-like Zn-dependent dehydrogenase